METPSVRPRFRSRATLFLVLGNAGIVSLLPLLVDTMSRARPLAAVQSQHVPLWLLVTAQVFQLEVELIIAVAVGLYVADRAGLRTPATDALIVGLPLPTGMWGRLLQSLVVGVATGIGTIVLASALRAASPGLQVARSAIVRPPAALSTAIATPYGGLTEELLTRLFLMSLLAYVIGGSWRLGRTAGHKAMWLAIIGTALIFGLGHLPYASYVLRGAPGGLVIARTLILNGAGGLVFGWLYWRRGIESAMVGHLAADVALHVVPALVPLAVHISRGI